MRLLDLSFDFFIDQKDRRQLVKSLPFEYLNFRPGGTIFE